MQIHIGEAEPRGDLAEAINAENAKMWTSLGLDPEGMLKVTEYPLGGEVPSRLYFANLARGMLSVDLVEPMSSGSTHDTLMHIPRVVEVPACTVPYVKIYAEHVGLPVCLKRNPGREKDEAVNAVDSYLSTINVHETQFARIFNSCKGLLERGVIDEDSGVRMGDSVEHLRRLEHEHVSAVRELIADRWVTAHQLYMHVIKRTIANREN